MNQYNAELNRIQQAYNSEMQNPQNNLSQYRQQQFLPPVQPSHKKEDSAQHYLERSEHYYKRGEYDLSKSYLSKAKDTWMSETDRDWYADLESKLSKKREEQ